MLRDSDLYAHVQAIAERAGMHNQLPNTVIDGSSQLGQQDERPAGMSPTASRGRQQQQQQQRYWRFSGMLCSAA